MSDVAESNKMEYIWIKPVKHVQGRLKKEGYFQKLQSFKDVTLGQCKRIIFAEKRV